eukprot:COSAG01_NODE_1511_length_10068_cov_7.643731_6_plen_116_part_00
MQRSVLATNIESGARGAEGGDDDNFLKVFFKLLFKAPPPPGPTLAGLMAERFGLSSPFLFCGAFLLGTSGACYLFLPETRTASSTESDSATPVDSSSAPGPKASCLALTEKSPLL